MKEYRAINPWHGVTALALITAATVVAVLYGVIAMLLLNQSDKGCN